MIETKDLVLDKAKYSDWEEMYRTVWSQPESAKYMFWDITTNEEDAKVRIQKTIEFQKTHDMYFVYEKSSGKPIGFAGVEQISPSVCQETGICLGPNYVGKGFGKQILGGLIAYCTEKHNAKEFLYLTKETNAASIGLAKSFGFTLITSETVEDYRDGQKCNLLKYSLKL